MFYTLASYGMSITALTLMVQLESYKFPLVVPSAIIIFILLPVSIIVKVEYKRRTNFSSFVIIQFLAIPIILVAYGFIWIVIALMG